MASDVDWGPSPGPPEPQPPVVTAGTEVDDLLALGPQRPRPKWLQRLAGRANRVPVWTRLILAAVIAGGAIVAYATNRASPPRTPTVASVPATGHPGAPGDQAPGDQQLALVLALARQPGLLTDYDRLDSSKGACALVPIGRSPQRAIAVALRTALPGYTVRGVARTLDQFTALCTIELRATDRRGTVLVIEVVAPPQGTAHNDYTSETIASRSDGATAITLANAVTPDGWSITVGAVGPITDLPEQQVLLRLAESKAMVW